MLAHIAESPLGRLEAVTIENILVEKPQRPHTYPAVYIRNDAKHKPAITQHIQIRNITAEHMKTAVKIKRRQQGSHSARENIMQRLHQHRRSEIASSTRA